MPSGGSSALHRNRGKASSRSSMTPRRAAWSRRSSNKRTPVTIIRLVGSSMRSQAASTLESGVLAISQDRTRHRKQAAKRVLPRRSPDVFMCGGRRAGEWVSPGTCRAVAGMEIANEGSTTAAGCPCVARHAHLLDRGARRQQRPEARHANTVRPHPDRAGSGRQPLLARRQRRDAAARLHQLLGAGVGEGLQHRRLQQRQGTGLRKRLLHQPGRQPLAEEHHPVLPGGGGGDGQLPGGGADGDQPAGTAASPAQRAVPHFGYDRNASYMVFTPTGKSTLGFSRYYCGWHDQTSYRGQPVAYVNVPYQPDGGAGCGKNYVNQANDSFGHGYFDGFSIVAGHEYAETVTDPDPNTAAGWLDRFGEENGDKCAWGQGPGPQPASQNLTFGGQKYAVQPLWSNSANRGTGGCTMG